MKLQEKQSIGYLRFLKTISIFLFQARLRSKVGSSLRSDCKKQEKGSPAVYFNEVQEIDWLLILYNFTFITLTKQCHSIFLPDIF